MLPPLEKLAPGFALILLLAAPCSSAAEDDITRVLVQDGRQLEVRISGQFEPAMQEALLGWLEQLAAALSRVYGHWPRQRWQISVAPATSASTSDPIPWGEVHRDSVNRVEFFTLTSASQAELLQAWTGYHELAHLLIPYRGWGDAWFTEGLASYYQNILATRIGVMDEQQMWQKLYDGFQRGLLESRFDGTPLYEVSDAMRENGGFMRVYWSGAWYFLAADARLRLQSGGQRSLDLALAELNQCCAEQRLSVPEMVAKLDQLNRVVLFGTLYREVANSTHVPAFEDIFASLGIDLVDGQVHLQQAGPGARLRRQIASGPAL